MRRDDEVEQIAAVRRYRPHRPQQVPPDSPIRLTLEPHYGNVLEQPEDFE
jgi:hypothetical protein